MIPRLRYALALALAATTVLLSGCGEKPKTVPVYGMGDKVAAGHLIYTALETEWLTHLGQGASQRVPQNRFLVIHLTIVNNGASQISVPTMSVEDESGAAVTELTNGDQLEQWLGELKMASPTDSLQGAVMFDVAPQHYRLRVFDENAQQSALIDIPLNFNTDTPSAPVTEGGAKK